MERIGRQLLAQARDAGLVISAEDGNLTVRGRKALQPLALQVLEQKPAMMALLALERCSASQIADIQRMIDRLVSCSSTVSIAHVLRDLQEAIDASDPDAPKWEAVLRATVAERQTRRPGAKRCRDCGAERLWFQDKHPCPVCDDWQRPKGVPGTALRLVLEDEFAHTNPTQRNAEIAPWSLSA